MAEGIAPQVHLVLELRLAHPNLLGLSGIIMSMHLFSSPHPNQPDKTRLKLLSAYENGEVILREFTRTDKETSVEGISWEVMWRSKLHVESSM